MSRQDRLCWLFLGFAVGYIVAHIAMDLLA